MMNQAEPLRAPFPYHGGKRKVARVVWRAFDPSVPGFVEPFFGSGAVLLGRPGGAGKIETVNDIDSMICNFYRAIREAPDETARWCDRPINEIDLHASHTWLIGQLESLTEKLRGDVDYYDPKIAGLWVWGICQWIGTGWVAQPKNRKHPRLDGMGKGVHAKLQAPAMNGHGGGAGALSPNLTNGWKQKPYLRTEGQGVHAPDLWQQRPHLSSENGVHLPALGNDRGINGVAAPPALEWFRALSERLRRVRVVCGDWNRVVTDAVLGKGKNVGGRRPVAVFLDPPYSTEFRKSGIYRYDGDQALTGVEAELAWERKQAAQLSTQVREWAIEHGDDPDLRIALCGYFEEHGPHMPDSWTVYRWKGARGYAREDNDNREKETIWFSRYCLPLEGPAQLGLAL